ncbi:MAG: hypothetical protein Tsb0020_48640 [Haliangiales bacterium]
MSTLAVVEEILRETQVPMSVRQIVEYAGLQHAGGRLPTRSKTPDTVIARDLSMDIKRKGESSLFARTSPGRYTLRELLTDHPAVPAQGTDTPQTGNGAHQPTTLEQVARAGDAPGQPTPGQPVPGQATPSHTTVDRPLGDQPSAQTVGVSAVMKSDRAAPLAAKRSPSHDGQAGTGR